MFNEELELLIDAALCDGELTDKEREILFKKAAGLGIEKDEFELILNARILKSKKEAKKSNKYGDVRKCPACGAMVPAFSGACTECGYEFSNVEATLSSKQLADKLVKSCFVPEKKNIIETFPIPVTKSDLLEFITSMKPKMTDVKDPLSKSYFKKYEECIEKAKISFPKDKDLQKYVSEFHLLSRNLKIKRFFVLNLKWITIIAVIVAIAIFSFAEESLDEYRYDKFLQAIEKNDMAKAKELLTKLESKQKKEGYKIIAPKLIANGEYQEAMKCYEKYGYMYVKDYYQFMSDVVAYLCSVNKKNDAVEFVKEYSLWFKNEVDNDSNHNTDEDYKMYHYSKVKSSLMKYINEY